MIEEEIFEQYDWKSVTGRRVRKYLPLLYLKHGLIEVIANNELKEKYGITSKGYPKIILKKT